MIYIIMESVCVRVYVCNRFFLRVPDLLGGWYLVYKLQVPYRLRKYVMHDSLCIMHHASCIMHHASNTKTDNNTGTDTDTDILIPILIWWKTQKTTYDGRRFMMEDDLWWHTPYDGRRLMMKHDLWCKTTYDGRRLMMEDDLWWKTT